MVGHSVRFEPARHLWQAFHQVSDEGPDRPALVFADRVHDFRALRAAAERTAAWLASQGIGRGDIVAIQLPKRFETYAIWLASLRQGCPYVFVDPRNPANRTASILQRLKPRLFVSLTDAANPYGATLRLQTAEDGQDWLGTLPQAAPPAAAALSGLDPAYVMFTSGSTGEPKGAVIPHQGVLSLMYWVREAVAAGPDSRFSNLNPLHFDNAVFDLYGGLLNGFALVPVETGGAPNPAQWVRRLRDGEADVVFAVPTLFQTLSRLKLLKPESLPAKVFVFGGEGFPAGDLAEFHGRFAGRARLINVYGPTETSCICSSIEIDSAALAAAGSGFPSLGRMHADFDHAILDEDARDVARGEAGELWIGGANVGLGYYANPDETNRRFRQDPRQSAYRSIWYRTGDLVREDEAGLLWFVGRVDNQVKIRGHRIELEEIDLAIESLDGVKRAVTVAVPGGDGPELRAAFVATRQVAEDEVCQHCLRTLPPYMQPARIMQVEILPQNANGKVDRKAVTRLMEAAR